MRDIIRSKCQEVCSDHGVWALAAREAGSRMMGVAHEGSDYDVKLLFYKNPEKYIGLDNGVETIERKFHEETGGSEYEVDVDAWDVKKFARYYTDTNPDVTEFLSSNKTYFDWSDGKVDRLERDMMENFNHMSLYNHYLSLAKSNYEKYVERGMDRTYNRQFYILRAVVMAKVIRELGEIPKVNVWSLQTQYEREFGRTDELQLLENLSKKKRNGVKPKAASEPNVVGEYFEAEYERDMMEPTDERIKSPSNELADKFVKEVVMGR